MPRAESLWTNGRSADPAVFVTLIRAIFAKRSLAFFLRRFPNPAPLLITRNTGSNA